MVALGLQVRVGLSCRRERLEVALSGSKSTKGTDRILEGAEGKAEAIVEGGPRRPCLGHCLVGPVAPALPVRATDVAFVKRN